MTFTIPGDDGSRLTVTYSPPPGRTTPPPAGGGTTTPPPPPPPSGSGAPHPRIETWVMEWSNSGSPLVSTLSPWTNVVNLAFLQGNGQPVGWGSESQAQLVADLRGLKARPNGCSVLAGIGGSGGQVNLSNADQFVQDVLAYRAALGGQLDGINWDVETSTFDADAAFTISQNLALSFAHAESLMPGQVGPFQAVVTPNGGNVDTYLPFAVRLQQAGLLTAYGQQYYDATVSEKDVEGRINQSIAAGIPIEKTTVGMMIPRSSGDTNPPDHYWTLPQCIANMTAIRAKWPTIGGCFIWEAGRPQSRIEWEAAMARVFGLAGA